MFTWLIPLFKGVIVRTFCRKTIFCCFNIIVMYMMIAIMMMNRSDMIGIIKNMSNEICNGGHKRLYHNSRVD
ncbi:MAG: hypothetical protein JWP81_4741 [Ferruginibacter sp.]|nr:hypothetical protein [Ferruginibacter sp.]